MKKSSLILFLIFISMSLAAQNMFDYSDIRKGMFEQKTITGLRSMNDGEHYTILKEGRIEKYAYKTGEKIAVLFDKDNYSDLIKGGFVDYEFDGNENKILITANKKNIYRRSYTADNYIFDINASKLWALSKDGGEQVPTFSADGTKVGFVRDNNIYYVNLYKDGPSEPVMVTSDGKYNFVINGHTDWVYEEEFAFTCAYDFSPDSKKIAYLRFDESNVKEFTIARFLDGLYPKPLVFKYPKAGEKNSEVEVWCYDLEAAKATKIDTGNQTDQYIPFLGWTNEGDLYFYRTNRLQNHFELVVADNSGRAKVIYDEKDSRYVERLTDQTVTFLPKGRFVIMNETSGYNHLYLYDQQKGLVDTLTKGNWEVKQLVEVTNDKVYYISNESSPLRNNLYSVRLNGKGKTRLTNDEGTYTISPSKGVKYFISYFSNAATPNLVRLHNSSGKAIRVLEDNAALLKSIVEKQLPRKEFFSFTTEKGVYLNGYTMKPRNFDSSKKYPVMMVQYSGPGSQQAIDKWGIDWYDVLVQEGYIVVCVDGRGTGGRGADFRKITYGNLGKYETEDQISAAKYVASLPYVDSGRIGIYGWSFGGFMALNCILKGNDVFKVAISVAPVTSWRFYDTIYTEIYNGLPQDNPRGYDENSPINYAGMLKGKLLLVHGTCDDNVHVQNAFRMTEALIKAGKQFDMMIYPDDNHSMNPSGRHHIMEKLIDYTVNNL